MDPIEALSVAEQEHLALQKLNDLLAYVRERSPFYAARLPEPRIDSLQQLSEIPPLSKDDLLELGPPNLALLTGPLASAYVFRSGGTTGRPKMSVFSSDEFRRYVDLFKRTYMAAGLTPQDRVANVFTVGSLYASFIFVNRMLEEMGCLNFPFTTHADPEWVAAQVDAFGINTLMGFPSWLMQVMAAIGPGKIEKVFYAGEHFRADERAYLHEEMGVSLIASGGYGAVDTGLMGLQCDHAQGSEHHVLNDHVILEVVHPETGEALPPGEEGMVLVTCLDRRLMPIIRYTIGDLARCLPEPCPCGRTSPRFELLRRSDDALRIGYTTVQWEEVAGALNGDGGPQRMVQLVKERVDNRDRLTVRVEVVAGDTANEDFLDGLTERVLTQKPDLAALIDKGYVEDLEIELYPKGSLPTHPITGKTPRAVDLS